MLASLIIFIIVQPVLCSLGYTCGSPQEYNARIVNGIVWQDDGPQTWDSYLNGSVLVDIMLDKSLFDHCSLSSYSPQGIAPLLRTYYRIHQFERKS